MESFRVAFDHLFILAIARAVYAFLGGIMSAQQAIGPGGAFAR